MQKKKKKKMQQSKKLPKNGLTELPGEVCVYLISSTSMQKENPSSEFRSLDKNLCEKYKFAERSHNFLIPLPMQLIFNDL